MKHLLALIVSIFIIIPCTFPQSKNVYEIYAISYGAVKSKTAASEIAIGGNPADSVSLTFYFWYLSGDNGRNVLVDAGFLPDSSALSSRLKDYQRPDLALQRLHVNPDDITDLVITHTHMDHIDGVPLFPKATLWIQKNDYVYLVSDAWQENANHMGLEKKDVLPLVQANLDGRLRLVDGDSIEIIPGIRVFRGSRHTFESQHLFVRANGGNVMLASDDCWFYYNLDHLLPVPLTFDVNAYTAQLRRMKTLVSDPKWIIPGHDALVLTRFPQVAMGVVRIR